MIGRARIIAAVVFALCGLACHDARAQTAITRDQANHYYQSCLSGDAPDSRMTPNSREALCACTAAHLTETMSQEDYAAIGNDGAVGQEAFHHFLLDVYTPCMAMPAGDITAGDCAQLPNLALMQLKASPIAVCRCTGDKTGQWFAENGRELVAAILREAPDTVNPFDPVMSSPVFKRAAYDNLTSCIGTVR